VTFKYRRMNNETTSDKSRLDLSTHFPNIALVAISLFLTLLIVLHFIEPEYEPSKHLISEYELGHFGWLMSMAFFFLGVGVFTMVLCTWPFIKTKGSITGRWIFLIITVALFGAAIFYPYSIPNMASTIHTFCGVIVIFTFPIAATLSYKGLINNQTWAEYRKSVSVATWLVWVGFIVFFGSLIIFHPETSENKAGLVVGWQNRFMMFTYSYWILVVGYRAKAIKNKN